jgi:hypothetical protein
MTLIDLARDLLFQKRSCVSCTKGQEDTDGRAVTVRFVTAIEVDPAPVSLDELLCDE